jgi:tRNA dimethylallyltransferase
MSKKEIIKIVAIVGPTASGKTNLGVKLCSEFNGEVISADSRQVFKHMDVGSGKDIREYTIVKNNKKIDIPYHLIDIVEPNEEYSLAHWLKSAQSAIKEINLNNKIPIIVGGTNLYVEALLDGYNLSEAKANPELRKILEKKTTEEIFKMLEKIDYEKACKLNNSEKNNKRRLIRMLEISTLDKHLMPGKQKTAPDYDSLVIGISLPKEELKKRILHRLNHRLEKENMVEEVIILKEGHRLPSERLESFGLEYKYISMYLDHKINYEEMKEKIYFASCQFAKRQLSWLRRWEKGGTKIYWVESLNDAKILLNKFLKQNV